MPVTIDKQLPVAIQAQIVGAVEYGIMAGTLRPEQLLPSVRVLSKQLGVAQLTVSHAYSTLKALGLIRTIPGKGTYVVRDRQYEQPGSPQDGLRLRFLQLLCDAQALNLAEDFFQRLLTRHAQNTLELTCPVAYVGNSNRMNQRYLAAIRQTLGMTLQADSYTFSEFTRLDSHTLSRYGLYLTLPHEVPRLRQRLGRRVPVYAPWLIPAPQTRQKLGNITRDQPLLLVAHSARFLPVMLAGVKRYARQACAFHATTLDDPALADLLHRAAVTIYSTGCHTGIQQYPACGIMLEYSHIPDPDYLHNELAPALRLLAQ
ncbi:GntR family transcriptional regulator [Shimwellia blattae]|uniref:HTH gntR-type domain-containing protein n=1 Tax=Shimwellia blattae (strain ATCC 29907 / DSM 4481 / JCM 1650 / NBRC 105725 / CDC 9005-74) TaxID=630626 RepID=I2B5U3_SHIBC|nr:GntR family transcriptional regulator [Shimwellia blattae]AFJ45897.1 hypothetical protein EBL_c07740 [Shimwellia blattae DSM 4481 = NBRC 105725]GAB81657.1 putative GntR family transcriptional regulator [Shimwellia blattae DSM 4481 = NBRC 105725]VDY63375.1 HTH-type transcriptional repressor yvoA [Shimwellia blattae]VEC21208.1 HTH-type transcriptional repressor yvoA [Shimwellia blattae]